MRRRIHEEDRPSTAIPLIDDDSSEQSASFNKLVAPVSDDDLMGAKTRRMRWLGQVCEYWPLRKLAAITDSDVEAVLTSYNQSSPPIYTSSQQGTVKPPRGRITPAQATQTSSLVQRTKQSNSPT